MTSDDSSGDELRLDQAFVMVPVWVFRAVDEGALQVYVYLLDRAHHRRAWPNLRTIAEECRCSPSSVRRRIRGLVDAGALTVETRYRSDGGQTSNVYTVRTVRPPRGTPEPVDNPVDNTVGGVPSVPPPPTTGDTPPLSPVVPLDQYPRGSIPKSARADDQQPVDDPEGAAYDDAVARWPKRVYGTEAARQRRSWSRAWRDAGPELADGLERWLDAMRRASQQANEARLPVADRYRPTSLAVWLNQQRWNVDPAEVLGGWLCDEPDAVPIAPAPAVERVEWRVTIDYGEAVDVRRFAVESEAVELAERLGVEVDCYRWQPGARSWVIVPPSNPPGSQPPSPRAAPKGPGTGEPAPDGLKRRRGPVNLQENTAT